MTKEVGKCEAVLIKNQFNIEAIYKKVDLNCDFEAIIKGISKIVSKRYKKILYDIYIYIYIYIYIIYIYS